MKNDLATSIGTAIIGAVIAYFVTNFFIAPIEGVSFKTISSETSIDLSEPDPEVFNYKSLNPTVEVYVGDCEEYDENGECLEDIIIESTEETLEEDINGGNENNRENS